MVLDGQRGEFKSSIDAAAGLTSEMSWNDRNHKLLEPKIEPQAVGETQQYDAETDIMDNYLAHLLMSIDNDPPTQRPVLYTNRHSKVKMTDLIGSIVERRLLTPSPVNLHNPFHPPYRSPT